MKSKPAALVPLASRGQRMFFLNIYFYRFHTFSQISAWNGMRQPAAHIETFARFQVGFLSSEDFHCILLIFLDSYVVSLICIDFH